MQNEYLTIDDVSKRLHLSKSSVYCYVGKKKIPHIKLGGKLLFPEYDLNTWLESMKNPVGSEPVKENL